MAYRYRAHFFFKENSPAGLAQWCSDQVNQRLTMSFHMNENALNEEKTKHEVVNALEWKADIFVPDDAQAIIDDFWAHIMTQTMHMETRVIEPEEEEGEPEYMPSWMDLHHCYHDIGGACMPPHQTFATTLPEEPTEPGEPTNACEGVEPWNSTQHWQTYTVGDKRTDGTPKKLYECKDPQWAQSYAPSSDAGHWGWTYIQDC